MRRALIGLIAICLIGLGIVTWLRRGVLGNPTTDAASHLFSIGNFSQSIHQIDSLTINELTTDKALLLANCYRRLGQIDRFEAALNDARKLDADREARNLAQRLLDTQIGKFAQSPDEQLHDLVSAGVEVNDAALAVVLGLVASNRVPATDQVFSLWESLIKPQSASAELLFARAIVNRTKENSQTAVEELLASIELFPDYELAYLALAETYAQPPRSDHRRAKQTLQFFVEKFPNNVEGIWRLATEQRKLADCESALVTLKKGQDSQNLHLARAEAFFDLGNYAQAVEEFKYAGLGRIEELVPQIDRAFSMTLAGSGGPAETLVKQVTKVSMALAFDRQLPLSSQLFAISLERVARIRRYIDLVSKQPIFVDDPGLTQALQATRTLTTPAPITPPQVGLPIPDSVSTHPGYSSYLKHCSHCHGVAGDGFGPAARHLFPLPRNFRREPLRIVSTTNRVASDSDLIHVIREGMPGASMPAFNNLSQSELESLIAVIRTFIYQGLQEQWSKLRDDDQITDDEFRDAWVENRSSPGAMLDIPVFPEPSKSTLLAGREAFLQVGCIQCHRLDDATVPQQWDVLGRPTPARQLSVDAFRGGSDCANIYRRIVLGIPGTSHPELTGVSQETLIALTQYVCSLHSETLAPNSNADRLQQLYSMQAED
ncbi:MAG: c-type cytochrome [Planctomycetales bacterium]|nr:c-type cytochrome [Planctomycetales bacterium]